MTMRMIDADALLCGVMTDEYQRTETREEEQGKAVKWE